MLLYVWLLFGVAELVARNVQLTHEDSLVRVAMDYSTHGGIINFVEGSNIAAGWVTLMVDSSGMNWRLTGSFRGSVQLMTLST